MTVSYFKWAQNLQCLRWTEEEVNARLRQTMTVAYTTIRDLAQCIIDLIIAYLLSSVGVNKTVEIGAA